MKWGILATGTIAKKFASTVEQMGAEGEQLVAVGSRHLESAQAFAQQYGIPRCYDSYEALAADPEKVETKEVHINEYGTDDYSRLVLTYPGGCMAESVQTIGQELERNARIVGTKGSIFLPDFQHAETMTLEVEGKDRRSSAVRWTSTALSMRSGKQAAASSWGVPTATATPRRIALP